MEPFTPRQNAVLECALQLLVAGGERALTTAGLARAANCSKESLYKWFGDRDGLLVAMITYLKALSILGTERCAPLLATVPIVIGLVAVPLLDEPLTGWLMAGLLLVSLGAFVASKQK